MENTLSKPEISVKTITKESFLLSFFLAFIFSLSMFLGFIAISYISFLVTENDITKAISVMATAALAYLLFFLVDKYDKSIWFKLLSPSLVLFFLGVLLYIYVSEIVGFILIFAVILPSVFCSVIALSYQGYFHDVSNRGKSNALTVGLIFGFLTIAALLTLFINVNIGLLFYGILGLMNGLTSLLFLKSDRINYIKIEHKEKFKKSKQFKVVKLYYLVLFCYKICLGMLLGIFLSVQTSVISSERIWFIAASISVLVTPLLGYLTDTIGRKNIFNLSCAIFALMFGLFAFTQPGFSGEYDKIILYICIFLLGITYPSMLVSEYSVFQDLSGDETRLKTVADGLFTHVGGIAVGLFIGTFFETPDIAYFFLATNVISIGLYIMANAKESLPDKEELQWRDALRHIYIYHHESGIGFCDYSFNDEEKVNEDLITGGLTGISTMIAEMTKREGNLTAIQQQNANILFSKGEYVIGALISDKNLKILNVKLKSLVDEFEELFLVYLKNFSNDVSQFRPAEVLIKRHFIQPHK